MLYISFDLYDHFDTPELAYLFGTNSSTVKPVVMSLSLSGMLVVALCNGMMSLHIGWIKNNDLSSKKK